MIASDHGGLSARGGRREVATSNRPFRAGKGHLYEGGLRIPLIIRWPGQTKAGSTNETPVMSTDLFPTFLDMAGLPLQPQDHRDGVSLASTADLFSSAIRVGNLKLIEFPEEQRVELYDLANDVGKARNLTAERPADRELLLQALHEWKKKVGAAEKPRTRRR